MYKGTVKSSRCRLRREELGWLRKKSDVSLYERKSKEFANLHSNILFDVLSYKLTSVFVLTIPALLFGEDIYSVLLFTVPRNTHAPLAYAHTAASSKTFVL